MWLYLCAGSHIAVNSTILLLYREEEVWILIWEKAISWCCSSVSHITHCSLCTQLLHLSVISFFKSTCRSFWSQSIQYNYMQNFNNLVCVCVCMCVCVCVCVCVCARARVRAYVRGTNVVLTSEVCRAAILAAFLCHFVQQKLCVFKLVGWSGATSDLYLEGAPFKTQTGHWMSWLYNYFPQSPSLKHPQSVLFPSCFCNVIDLYNTLDKILVNIVFNVYIP